MAFPLLVTIVFWSLGYLIPVSATTLGDRGLGVWTVSSFHAFTASPGRAGVSTLTFNFPNSTTTTTKCTRKLASRLGVSVIDPDHFYLCDDTKVSYKYGGSWLAVTTITWENDGSMTTNFGNMSLSEHCYTISTSPDPSMNGMTCEMATPEVWMPLLQSTIISNTGSMSSAIKSRIANALAQISTQKSSVYNKGLQKRYLNYTEPSKRDLEMKARQLGMFSVSKFVSHNYNAIDQATSDIGFNFEGLGFSTHCSASRLPGQGSAATGGFQPCDFSAVMFMWNDPLNVTTQVTLPAPDGTTRTFTGSVGLNGFCIQESNNGNNIWSKGNRCMTYQDVNLFPIANVTDVIPSLPVPQIFSTASTMMPSSVAAPPSTTVMPTNTSIATSAPTVPVFHGAASDYKFKSTALPNLFLNIGVLFIVRLLLLA